MASQEQEARRFRTGQQVRIITCPLENPEHIGKIGTVISYVSKTQTVRVRVGMGICRALASGVESADDETSEEPFKQPYRYEWNARNTKI